MAMNLRNELQAVNKELKTLSKKVEKILLDVGKAQKVKPAKKSAPKKSAPKKSAPKKSASKKPDKSSATDAVMNVIKRSRKTVDIKSLKAKTGFQGQKLHNIVYILKKQGKIKSAGKGAYVKA